MFYLECIGCHEKYSHLDRVYVCKKCGDLLTVMYNYDELSQKIETLKWKKYALSVWRYKELLPITDKSKIVSLGEGGTRLYRCSKLEKEVGVKRLYLKNEGENPTGSFKDRGMTVGITKALEYGVKVVICASTGNTSASLSAYAAKAGINCIVIIPAGKVAYGKLAQAIIYGAKIIQVSGNFDDALKMVFKLSLERGEIYLLNSVNPYRLEGQKTLAFEVVDQLKGLTPDNVVVPVGNAGNISAIWKGFFELKKLNLAEKLPRMFGVQAEGAAPIAKAVKSGEKTIKPVPNPETVATAIRIGSPVNWKKAMDAIKQSNGGAEIVTDTEILEAQRKLAKLEGLFVEPASASSIAGLKRLVESGEISKDETVVCVATGHGLKDPDTPVKFLGEEIVKIDINFEELKKILGILKG
ncbi:MAG: threonine synthase [Candidatus Bathyarchaeota archaeon]